MRDRASNDTHFDPEVPLATLPPEQALAYLHQIIDAQCDEKDEAYLKAVASAGDQSVAVSLAHATQGSPVAQLAYGVARLQGLHVAQDVAEALFWLRRAHVNGNGQASVVLCGAYLEGRAVRREVGKALAYLMPAAGRGVAKAQYVLACLLLDGETMPIDEARAVRLLQDAARSGDAPSRHLLAENGIPLD